MKKLGICLVGLLFCIYGFSPRQVQVKTGKEIFDSKCAKCHGTDGIKERAGAKNLRLSKLSDPEIMAVIQDGKKVMPAFKKKLLPEDIRNVGEYVKNFRKY